MRKFLINVFSIILIVLGAITLLISIEFVLTAVDKPILPVSFWETDTVSKMMITMEMERGLDLLQWFVIAFYIFCLVPYIICWLIGNSIMKPMREWGTEENFEKFTREHLLLRSIGNLLFVPCLLSLPLVHFFINGIGGIFIQYMGFFGVPCIIFAVFNIPTSVEIIFLGKEDGTYCVKCNHGSLKQFGQSSTHTHDVVTTTTYSDGSKSSSREAKHTHKSICRNCGYNRKTTYS